jgi:hypothetical protein
LVLTEPNEAVVVGLWTGWAAQKSHPNWNGFYISQNISCSQQGFKPLDCLGQFLNLALGSPLFLVSRRARIARKFQLGVFHLSRSKTQQRIEEWNGWGKGRSIKFLIRLFPTSVVVLPLSSTHLKYTRFNFLPRPSVTPSQASGLVKKSSLAGTNPFSAVHPPTCPAEVGFGRTGRTKSLVANC